MCEWADLWSGPLNAPRARIGDCRVQANQEKNGGEETEMAVYVGIDVHKKYCQATLMSEQGQIMHELRFDNTQQGATSLVTLAKLTHTSKRLWNRPQTSGFESTINLRMKAST
ncbi:MAG: hypothetical protein ABSA92_14220 [Candidatus Bathyarchaeia archaeon]